MTISNNSSRVGRVAALQEGQAVIVSPSVNNQIVDICKNLTFDVNDSTFKEFLKKVKRVLYRIHCVKIFNKRK